MSQTIRTFGAGLLASAWLAQHYQMTYLHTIGRTSPNYAFELAIRSMGSGVAQVMGIGGYLIAVYLLLCLGAGMLLSGVLWPLLELVMLDFLRLPALLMQKAYGTDSVCGRDVRENTLAAQHKTGCP